MSDFVAVLDSAILCGVCVMGLRNPDVLSACGHYFCQQCLIVWFELVLVGFEFHLPYCCLRLGVKLQRKTGLVMPCGCSGLNTKFASLMDGESLDEQNERKGEVLRSLQASFEPARLHLRSFSEGGQYPRGRAGDKSKKRLATPHNTSTVKLWWWAIRNVINLVPSRCRVAEYLTDPDSADALRGQGESILKATCPRVLGIILSFDRRENLGDEGKKNLLLIEVPSIWPVSGRSRTASESSRRSAVDQQVIAECREIERKREKLTAGKQRDLARLSEYVRILQRSVRESRLAIIFVNSE
ncbi:hypothetical protein C8F04DRAFT_1244878 [Mycena alexandri]|uniref:RING-type domain-containing protein n=1 Tax=Mycena alexandri TaxID=1745969 RepID=A0AAD6RY01_9AGAR|nr:hypothetical protein C8F04DRAFT_1244878 [Mycena alexandri]